LGKSFKFCNTGCANIASRPPALETFFGEKKVSNVHSLDYFTKKPAKKAGFSYVEAGGIEPPSEKLIKIPSTSLVDF